MHPLEKKMQKKELEKPILIIDLPEELQAEFDAFESPIDYEFKLTSYAMILIFGKEQAALQKQVRSVLPLLESDGLFWISYPKKSSKRYRNSDCSRDGLIDLLATEGFETVRQVSVNEDWSALRYRNVKNIKSMKRSFAVTEEGKMKVEHHKEDS